MTPDELVAQVHRQVVDWRRHVSRSAQGGGERLCRLVIVGVRADGTKELVAGWRSS